MSNNKKPGIQAWVRRITDSEMPIFGRTVQEVVSVSQDDDSSAAQLGQAVLKDAAMTTQVLKLANSASYKPAGQRFSTISRAIMMLGFDTVRSMCLTVTLIDSLVQGVHREHLVKEMARSLHAATQAQVVASEMGDPSPEEVFIATLLYHIGDLAFWCFCGDEGDALDEALRVPGRSPEKAQREILGFTLRELGSALAREWALSEWLQAIIRNPDLPDRRSRCLILSRQLAEATEQGWGGKKVAALIRSLADLAGCDEAQLIEKLHQGAKFAVQNSASYGAALVGRAIPLPADVEIGELVNDVAASPDFPLPDPALQLKILRELTGLTRQQADFNMVMEMILEGIHRGIGMDRALFALMTPDRKGLRAKYVLGDQDGLLFKGFRFDLQKRDSGILSYCMSREESLWLDRNSPKEIANQLSDHLVERLGTRSFYLAPIVVKSKVIGVFYTDRLPSGRKLDADAFDSFTHFTQQANLVLNHLASQLG